MQSADIRRWRTRVARQESLDQGTLGTVEEEAAIALSGEA